MYNSVAVKVYYTYTMIALHSRVRTKHHYTTQENHLAPQHRYISAWTPENFIQQDEEIHGDGDHYISKVLEHKGHPGQAHKSCSGILNFARRVGTVRLRNACLWAGNIGQYNYRIIEEILRKQLDQLSPEEQTIEIPEHGNIRGKEYYQ